MNWDERFNNVIYYIETNLDRDIDFDKVARIMCQSKESFLRTFSFITNMTVIEYIRKRRMTLAALELQNNSAKIIDLAIKYGYESPESFARAFKAIHGMSPSAARIKGTKLSLFPRISCLITLKGEIDMHYQMENEKTQTVNLLGFQWEVMKSPNLNPIDNCYYLASKWLESNRANVLDLGAGLGQNAIYFSKQGFQVSALDISEYAMEYLNNWAAKENLSINTKVGDMLHLPYPDKSFDCIFAYHVISHTDSIGIKKIIAEIERVLRPSGEVYLTFCSKESTEFVEKRFPMLDGNTLICQDELEKGIPHYYADLGDLNELLVDFDVELIKQTEYYSNFNINDRREKFYYVNANLRVKN